jgi:hypothetical protein
MGVTRARRGEEERGRGKREEEGRERKRERDEEKGMKMEEVQRGRTNQKLLNVQSIINTSSQFTFLTKVIDPNLSSVSIHHQSLIGRVYTYEQGFSISLTYSSVPPYEVDQGDEGTKKDDEEKNQDKHREEEDVQVEYSEYCLTCPCSLPSAWWKFWDP